MRGRCGASAGGLLAILSSVLGLVGVAPLRAEVSRVDIVDRRVIGQTGYEKIVGTIHFLVDPKHPRNRVVVGLDKAPVDANGRVAFSADLYILRPLPRTPSNGVAIVDVVNRGRKIALGGFNASRGGPMDLASEAELGDGFLMRHGFTLAWVGWQFDVRRQNGLMGIDVPWVRGESPVRAVFTPNDRAAEVTVADLRGYTASRGTPAGHEEAFSAAQLTVRDGPYGPAEVVPPTRWQLRGDVVAMPGGFEPGRTYEIAIRAADTPVAGLGFVAVRDLATWLRYPSTAAAPARFTIAFGSSQSGRFLRSFLYEGFNADEKDRPVFDGVMAHIAGAGRLRLNERGAAPNALSMFEATSFPYADRSQRDPISGRTDGLLDNDRARRHQPKVVYTNTSVEYWGGGRAAALVHTSADGKTDLSLPDNVRAYLLAGTQHSPAPFPPRVGLGQQADNPVEYWWTLRALLLAMERWIKEGTAPPASQYPRLADQTLVPASSVAFPTLPGVRLPHAIPSGREGVQPIPFLVCQVDEDGNERAGVRAPDVAVPLATYTGWNFRAPATGAPGELVSLAGSAVPFAKTRADREKRGDPRRSVDERYASREDYLLRVARAADVLVSGGYLLAEDVARVVARAAAQWGL